MIASCPKCSARYRVDAERIGAEGARLRCARCEVVFRVRPPAQRATPLAPVAPVRAPEAAAPAPSRAGEGDTPVYDRERLVLVADPDSGRAKASVSALESWGLAAVSVEDGVEAMLAIQRLLPRVVVLDAALPKMFGFQVCEIVKRNESLRPTHVVLVGAIHHSERYRRAPVELYGADAYLEHPDLPEGLAAIVAGFGVSLAQAPSPPAAPVDDGLATLRAEAERLARVIVSDVVLYNAEAIEEAVQTRDLEGSLGSGLAEGRAFFAQRVDERVAGERDYLMEELERVVAARRTLSSEAG